MDDDLRMAEAENAVGRQAILCVDDEELMLFALTRELKRSFRQRYLYEQAVSAEQGLKAIEELMADGIEIVFIISDWLMPGMKGDEFLEAVHERYPSIHAIMITGQADKEAIARLKTNPSVLAVFSKPWNSAELIGLIERYSASL
jgi:DNA-binding NtrC family response regulator